MYKIKTDKGVEVSIQASKEGYAINQKAVRFDAISTAPSHFHLLVNNVSYQAEVVKIDRNKKTLEMAINGRTIYLTVSDEFDQLLIDMGISDGAEQKLTELKAPMPGLVLSISTKTGATVKQGEELLILEAMKMENILPSPSEVIIKQVLVKPGEKVDKNQTLITFE